MKTCWGFDSDIPSCPQGLESLSGLARIFLVATVQGATVGVGFVGGSDIYSQGVQVP